MSSRTAADVLSSLHSSIRSRFTSEGPELILVNMNSLYPPMIHRKPNMLSGDGMVQPPLEDNEAYKVVFHGSNEGCIVLIVEAKRHS